MIDPTRLVRALTTFVAIIALASTGVLAQQGEPPAAPEKPAATEREDGEEEEIRRRVEWFFSTRRAGTASDGEMRALRQAAVEFTRVAIAEKARKREGMESAPLDGIWSSMGPSPSEFETYAFGRVSGRVSALAADWAGNVLYVGTASGGLWRSADDGTTWTSIFDNAGTMTVGAIGLDPNDANVIWAGTGENMRGGGGGSCEGYFGIGLLRSGDGGATWESRNGTGANTLGDLSGFGSVVVDPRNSNHVIVGGSFAGCSSGSNLTGGLYSTFDGGINWTLELTGAIHEIRQNPDAPNTYWAGTGDGLYRSVDNGNMWALQSTGGLPTYGSAGRTELAIAPSDGNTVYALFGNSAGFWRTTNGGATWTLMSSGVGTGSTNACDGQCSYNMTLAVHPTDPDIIYRGTIRIWKSTDGGVTWSVLTDTWGTTQQVHQDTHVVMIDPDTPQTFWVGSDGGLWKSTDGGASFLNRNGNLNVTQFYAVGVDANDPDIMCGGSQDNSSLLRSASDVWSRQYSTGDGMRCYFDPVDPNYAYLAGYPYYDPGSPGRGYPRVRRSTSGPDGTFELISWGNGIEWLDRVNWVTAYVIDPGNPSRLYLGTHRVYRSDDHGSTWTRMSDDVTGGSGTVQTLEVSPFDSTTVFSGSVWGRVFRSANEGSTWTEITFGLPSSRSINDIAGDPTNAERAFAALGGFGTGHLWEWTLSGGWVERGSGLPNVPANAVVLLSPTELFVGTDTGVFHSTDGGVSFSPYMDGLPQGTVVTQLVYNENQRVLTAGTYGRGAWQVNLSPVVYSIADSGPGSLRQAILDATPGVGDLIRFDRSMSGQTILLSTAQLLVDKNLTIDASALDERVTVQQSAIDRVLEIAAGRTVSLVGLVIENGWKDYGGGIRNNGTLTLTDCEVAYNVSTTQGGGIYNYFGTLTLRNTTMTDNQSLGSAGAIWSAAGTTVLENVTVAGNTAPSHAGIVDENGAYTISHSTITDNHATGTGGGLSFLEWGEATMTIENSIVAGNTAATGPDVYRNAGTFTPTGRNLIGDNSTVTAEFPASDPLVGTAADPLDPGLVPPADWSGPAGIRQPRFDSPAVNAAVAGTLTPPDVDQRGAARPYDSAPDLGAIELLYVRNMSDSGDGSLRQLIADSPSPGLIPFASWLAGQTLWLTSGQLLIDSDLTIDGTTPAPGVTVNGNNLSRVFEIGSTATAALRNLNIRGGNADSGGGIRNLGSLTVTDCTVAGHSASSFAAGVYNQSGSLTILHSTVSDNHSSSVGGGIWNLAGDLHMENVTVAENRATNYAGVMNDGGDLTILHSTISGNHADNAGGGLTFNYLNVATLTIESSVVAGNTAPTGPDIYRISGTFTPTGNNLIGDNSTATVEFPESDPLVGTATAPLDPMLSPLGDFGGPTPTMYPRPGSLAIDNAVSELFAPLPTDQRGIARPSGLASDIGSMELVAGSAPGAAFPAGGDPADQMRASYNKVTGAVDITYTPACSATDHTIYHGNLANVATYGYIGATCGFGANGTAGFNPGPGDSFFVIVGSNGAVEGSHGLDGAGQERPEASGMVACEQPQDLTGTCDLP